MRDRPVKLKILREQATGTFTAFLDYPNGSGVEISAPSFRKLVNTLGSWNLDTSGLFEDQVPDGVGFLERALR